MTDYYKKGYLLMDNLPENEEEDGLGAETPEGEFPGEAEEKKEDEDEEKNEDEDEEFNGGAGDFGDEKE